MDIRFLGHACFELSEGDTSVLIDPFLTGNPNAAASADELSPSTILVTSFGCSGSAVFQISCAWLPNGRSR